jgi:tryptophan-rich hypothetical protein
MRVMVSLPARAVIAPLPLRRSPRGHRHAAASRCVPRCDAAPPPALPQRPRAPELDYSAGQFVVPNQRPKIEPVLDGRCFQCRPRDGLVTCPDCGGRGQLQRGGYNALNPVNLKSVVGTKWTASEKTFGWRHFVVRSKRKEVTATFVELVSTCDTTVQLWLDARNLKDRARWSCGWLERAEMRVPATAAGAALPGGTCRACSGAGECRCPACSAPSGVLTVR